MNNASTYLLLGIAIFVGAMILKNRQKPENVPVTMEDIQKAGGFQNLLPRQQDSLRRQYLKALADLRFKAISRQGKATAMKDWATASACQQIVIHLNLGAARILQGGDPTAEQQLVIEAGRALGN